MELGMTLPTMVAQTRADTLAWIRAIDEGPWSSLAVPERVTYPSHSMTVQLAAAAAMTERVRLWSTIVILPAHDAVQVAKDAATIDQLSAGRLSLGIGVGGREHDYRAIGASFERRWQRMDDQVAVMRRIWSGEPPFDGADPVGPPPFQAGGPPLIAGVAGPKALARAAKWAAGVDDPTMIARVSPEAAAGTVERIRAAWVEAGRTDAPHLSTSIWYALGDGAADRLHGYVHSYMTIFGEKAANAVAGAANIATSNALREAVEVCAAAGFDELLLVPTTSDPDELARTRDALGI
jgi:alkanesulfonate monooxygenase SsuD/methylene tetrahydromethanopterin reductase-like flavin-dependent oxidoreductase (luciferase family)